jgi:signal transduction histidine kinase
MVTLPAHATNTMEMAVFRVLFHSAVASMLFFGSAALAADQATPDEAKTMAVKAAEYVGAVGPEKAFAEFAVKGNAWHDRDLYVIVQDAQGTMLAHGTNPGLIGKSVMELKDVDGKPFNHEVHAIKDAGWINYKWQNPLTKAVEPKTMYIVHTGQYFVGVGAYAK